MNGLKISYFVKTGNEVEFDYFMDGNLYYTVSDGQDVYRFFVPIEDTGHSTFKRTDKAITFMRWIRKAIESNTFQKVSE